MPRLVRYDSAKRNLLNWITEAGELSDLLFCFDAGDGDSYDGTSQTWLDRSGNTNNVLRGTTSGADATDPTFNGTADGLSANEYFSNDGGDQFTSVTIPMPGIQPWHKNSGAFTLLFVINPQVPAGVDIQQMTLFGTANDLFDSGIIFAIGAGVNAGKQNVIVNNGGGVSSSLNALSSTTSFSSGDSGSWQVAGVKLDEGAGQAEFLKNTTIETFSPTYSSPSSSASTKTFFASGGWKANSKIALAAGWSRRLSNASYSQIYSSIKADRFTSLP